MENKNHYKTLCLLLAVSNLIFAAKDLYVFKKSDAKQKELMEQVVAASVKQVVEQLKPALPTSSDQQKCISK